MANIFYEIMRQVALTLLPDEQKENTQNHEYTSNSKYISKTTFLTKNEKDFFEALHNAAGNHYHIFSQVRLADIFNARSNDTSAYYTAFNKIAAKHVDFLLCSKNLKPIAGIELDDSTHKLDHRKQRDNFVNRLFEEAGLPLLRFPTQKKYNPNEISAEIAKVTGESIDRTTPPPLQSQNGIPSCPNCLNFMVIRQTKKGKLFWGCPNFPKCRETISIKDS